MPAVFPASEERRLAGLPSSAPSGSVPSAEAALRAVVLERIHCSLRAASRSLDVTGTIPSVTDVVFRGTVDGSPAVIKCCYGGLSVSRLMHLVGRGVDVARMAATWRERLPFSPEGLSLRWLSSALAGRSVTVPRVLHEDGDVLVIEDLGVPDASERAADARLLESLWAAVSAVWRRSADTAEMRALARINGAKSVEMIFRRKFLRPDALGASRGQFGQREDWAVFAGLGDAILGSYPPVSGRVGLLYGDLKPEHLLVLDDSLAVIDPAVRIGEPAEDVARFLMRSACLPDTRAAGAHTEGRREGGALREALIASAAATVGMMSHRQVLHLMAMDWMNILSTWQIRRRARGKPPMLTDAERARSIVLQRALLQWGQVDVLALSRELAACAETTDGGGRR